VAGVAGTVLPALPGAAFVLAGIVLAAWIDGFTRVGVGVVAVVSVLAVLSWLLEYAAGMLGAKKAGASRQALVGAALGEYIARRDHAQAVKVGVATWLGLMAGLVGKVVIVFMMLGIFAGAVLV
jgi:uncharacterized protein YqgC (DUF456 family)